MRPYFAASQQIDVARVNILERASKETAVIAWRDPTTGCYGDQRWRASHAREAGRCALTGMPIKAGDAVYRPRRGASPPANSQAMILAQAIDACAPLEALLASAY